MNSRQELQLQPENPSERYPLEPIVFKCNHCGLEYMDWKIFLNHLNNTNHRICYKCGRSCGGMAEYTNNEFIAIRKVDGNIETWKYKHVECPITNPSKRGR